MKPIIVSLYMDNTDPHVRIYQNLVIDKYRNKIPFYQLQTSFSHGNSMGKIMDSIINETDYDLVIFLDIDAIPLSEYSFIELMKMTKGGNVIAGSPQSTNHLPGANGVFVAPSVMAIGTELFKHIGRPSAEPTETSDVAELWSMSYRMVTGKEPNFFDILHYDGKPAPVRLPSGEIISVDYWKLDDASETKFGLNTTYGFNNGKDSTPLFFHSYQSFVPGQNEYFIRKCKGILDLD